MSGFEWNKTIQELYCESDNRTSLPATDMESNSGNESLGTEETQGLDTRVHITVTSYRKRVHDPDGISVKAVLDGLVRTGFLQDDSTKEIASITYKSIKSSEEKTIIEMTDRVK